MCTQPRNLRLPIMLILLPSVMPALQARSDEPAESAARPNVLLIAIDDLNDWTGCLGGHPQARTPHIDALAERGTLFTNAHCQAPICNPSRTSIMYGLRPSTTGVYMNAPKPWTVPALDRHVTLPRYFAKHGYRTYTTGKIYHGSGLPPDDFTVVGPRPGQKLPDDERVVPESLDGARGLWDFGPQTYDEGKFQDHADASWAIEVINSHDSSAQPFLLAIGFYRPHVPLYAPLRVFQQFPLADTRLPLVQEDDWDDVPAIAAQLMVAPQAPRHQWFVESQQWAPAVQAYLACTSWTDQQIGRLLQALDASRHAANTIVVLYSDHGFQLGEKQLWAKWSLWERSTHVPLIFAGPGCGSHARSRQPVELISIYPTLIDLCQLPPRSELEGASLRALLNDPQSAWPHRALTTHGKDNHSVRSDRYHYIRYRDGSEELYDLQNDPREWKNLAGDPNLVSVKASLAASLPSVNVAPARAGGAAKKRKSK